MATIDDIQFLKSNSIKHNKIILIDSAHRDKSVYRYANNYHIDFKPPIRNVVNVRIVNAFVPNGLFNIDKNNNTLIVNTGFCCSRCKYITQKTIKLRIKDYTLENLVELKLKTSSNDSNINLASILFNYGITIDSFSYNDKVSSDLNYLVFNSLCPFIFNYEGSTILPTIGFNEKPYSDYDLDLNSSKTDYGLYKTNLLKNVFASYYTQSLNKYTYDFPSNNTSNNFINNLSNSKICGIATMNLLYENSLLKYTTLYNSGTDFFALNSGNGYFYSLNSNSSFKQVITLDDPLKLDSPLIDGSQDVILLDRPNNLSYYILENPINYVLKSTINTITLSDNDLRSDNYYVNFYN